MSSTDKDPAWLDRRARLDWIRGYAEAAKLLNDPRLKTDYFSLFLAAGANQGLAGEAGKRSLLNLHGLEHRRLRSEIAPVFRPRAVDRMRPFARATAERLLADCPDSKPFDFMAAFTHPYIAHTTAHFLGIPMADVAQLTAALNLMSEAVLDLKNCAHDLDKGAEQLLAYARASLRKREIQPSKDVIGTLSEMVSAETIDELFAANLIVTVLSAGLEPTILQLGLIIEELALRPVVWDSMATDTASTPQIIEELLRYKSTNPGVVRRFEETVEHDNIRFPKGARVHISIDSANHDARRYTKPQQFDVEANTGSHMAFGFGPHHCLGAPLVRMQMQEALRALTPRLHCPEVTGAEQKKGDGLTGPVRLNVKVQRREAVGVDP
ncbi:MAG: cytochrome P450 [Halioglobus sp.]|nr:cytochrome P450 [Halioglobus sp.]